MYQISAETGNFVFLDQVCPKKGISSQKRKNWTNITIEFCMLELD